MDKYIIQKQTLNDIADAINEKAGTSGQMTPIEMAEKIANLPSGIIPTGTTQITSNGTYNVTEFASAEVNVPRGSLRSKVFEVTLASDQSSSVTLVANDADIIEHINDDTFSVSLLKVSNTSDIISYGVASAHAGNCPLTIYGSDVVYGIIPRTPNGTMLAFIYKNIPLKSSNSGAGVNWNNPNLNFLAYSGAILGAGKYFVICSW